MEISEQDLQTFIDLYRKEFNVLLSGEEATEKLTRLRELYKALYLRRFHPTTEI